MYIYIHVHSDFSCCGHSLSLADCYIACDEGEYIYRDGYRDQIVTGLHCVVGVSLLSKTHPLTCIRSTVMAQVCIPVSILAQSLYMPLFVSNIFSLTCVK